MKQKRNKKIPAIAVLSTLAFATLTAPVFAQTTLNLSGKAKVNNVQINSDAKITTKDEAKITGDVTIKAGATPDLTDINLSPGKEIKVTAPEVTLSKDINNITKDLVKLEAKVADLEYRIKVEGEQGTEGWKAVPANREIEAKVGNIIEIRVPEKNGWVSESKTLKVAEANIGILDLDAPATPAKVEELKNAIAKATAKHAKAEEGTKPGQYKEGSKAAFKKVIDEAGEAVKEGATEGDVREALEALKAAEKKFDKAKVAEVTIDPVDATKLTTNNGGITGAAGAVAANATVKVFAK
ncbi:hypothetical protein, partial [Aneurinibacillus aneurinilyticus]|uniref:hypothetical protein n=1 Tax=Aneurinibacillus aneurinilyticus TaxID=1391 RepID=UPI0036728B7A